jgi:hypothetical protein
MFFRYARVVVQGVAIAAGLCAAAYGVYVVYAFVGYGHTRVARESDALVDRFMPVYDIREQHRTNVNASAAATMEAARRVSFDDSPLIRAIFRSREIVLRAKGDGELQPAFVDFAQRIGWRVLANTPGREMVFGAVTQPWLPNVTFRGLDPAAFAAFNAPDYVKIVWTLRADPLGPSKSRFMTETRAVATDGQAREKFRRYWAAYSAGIVLIRYGALSLVKSEAERQEHEASVR